MKAYILVGTFMIGGMILGWSLGGFILKRSKGVNPQLNWKWVLLGFVLLTGSILQMRL